MDESAEFRNFGDIQIFHNLDGNGIILGKLIKSRLVGEDEAFQEKDTSMVAGVPYMLMILHTSFSVGLLAGIFRQGKPPNDRV